MPPRSESAVRFQRREPRRSGIRARVVELYEFRALLPYFGWRFVEKRYARTWLGRMWVPLRPGLDVSARAFLFGGVLGVQSGDRPYLVFFVVGVGAWQIFERAAYWGTRSQELNRNLLRRLYIPRLLLLLSAAVPACVEAGMYAVMAAAVLVGFRLFDGVWYLEPGLTGLWLLPGFALLLALGLTIGLWTAHTSSRARDVRFVQGYLIGFLFYITPVIYPLSSSPQRYRILAELNPVTAPIEMVKSAVLGTAGPTPVALVSCFVVIAVGCTSGLLWFGRQEAAALRGLGAAGST